MRMHVPFLIFLLFLELTKPCSSDSGTHFHTCLNHKLSASVITDLTSFLHVNAAKPFVCACSCTDAHTYDAPLSVGATVIGDGQSGSSDGEILIGAEQQTLLVQRINV